MTTDPDDWMLRAAEAAEKADINLPPLPRLQVPRIDADIDLLDIRRLVKWAEDIATTHARAAVEADRRERMRDNAGCISKLAKSDKQDQSGGVTEMVRDHVEDVRHMVPSDEEIEEFCAAYADEMGCIHDDTHVDMIRDALSRYSGVQPANTSHGVLVFDGGSLHIQNDGSGCIIVPEEQFALEDDRCEGPDGPHGSVHWTARIPASEVAALRNFLGGHPAASAEPCRCEDCPPVGYPTDKTRCAPCDRRTAASAEPVIYIWFAQSGTDLGHIQYWTRDPAQAARQEARFDRPPMRLFAGGATVAKEPVAYLACDPETGEPVWSEDCVCKDNVYSMEDTGTIGRPVVFAPVAVQPVVTDEMVTRFLGWHLPQDFAPDAGISFNPSPAPHSWPVGTNLLTDPQARAMLEYVLTGVQK